MNFRRSRTLFCRETKWHLSQVIKGSLVNLILWSSFLQITSGQGLDQTVMDEHQLLDSLLNASVYDKRIHPKQPGGVATEISLDCFIRSVSSIDEIDMDFSIDILVRQHWIDRRLKYNASDLKTGYIIGSPEVVARLWKPDLFFANEKRGYFHDVTQPNTMLRLYPTGEVLYSARYSLVLACDMNLEKFPFDTQYCFLQMGSFSFTESTLHFSWLPENPISVNENLKLPKFNLTDFSTLPCRNEHYTGNFSCLKLQFTFGRLLGYHFVQSYIPNILLVIASWISFWLDVDAIPARVTLGVTALLTTTAQGNNIKNILPPVSYTKAIDVWVGVCTFFVFGALIEFALVNLMARRDTKKTLSMASYNQAEPERIHFDRHQSSVDNRSFDFSPKLSPILDCETRFPESPPLWNNHNTGNEVLSMHSPWRRKHSKECPDCGEPLVFDMKVKKDNFLFSRPAPAVELINKPRAKLVDKVARYLFPLSFLAFLLIYGLVYGVIKS